MTTAEEDMMKWADEYLKKSKKDAYPFNGANPFDYVTITTKEYKKLIKAETRIRAKVEAEYEEKLNKVKTELETYQQLYRDKKSALEEAKQQIQEMLGLQEEVKNG